ncbi:hypothetical protein BD413DRAFT_528901, partial [Trametes elegans]
MTSKKEPQPTSSPFPAGSPTALARDDITFTVMRPLYLVCMHILTTLGFPFLLVAMPAVRAGNTACASSQLDWYTSVVGETPCATYERLRQICNSYYQLGTLVPSPPGDHCDDQFSTCCCNTVAFQLSMLCLNCQHDTVSGQQTGVDAR